MSLILLGTAIGSAWICMRLPGSKTDSIGFGMTMGFFICATGLIGEFPVLGQAALWLALRPVIRFIFGLFHVDPVSLFWTLPPDLRTLLFDMLGIDLPKINIVDLLFWGAFSLSVVCSLAAIDGWLRRRRLRSGSMD